MCKDKSLTYSILVVCHHGHSICSNFSAPSRMRIEDAKVGIVYEVECPVCKTIHTVKLINKHRVVVV